MNTLQQPYPRVGLAVWLQNDKGEFLMMKRQGSHGSGTWAPPGGKLEMGETFYDCCQREAKEETDISIGAVELVGAINDIFDGQKHYATLHFIAKDWSGQAKIMEPHKCTEIGWYDIHSLPQPLFLSVAHLMESDFPCLCGAGKAFRNCAGRFR